jgi:hypothetical protein
MKKKVFFVPLLLCLALFGSSRPGLADSVNPIPTDLLIRLEKEGWKTAAPGVMQHTVGNTVETLGFGDDGLRFRIKELKAHLAFLRKKFAHHPSPELRQAIRAHRAEVLRAQEALREAGELESSTDALVAAGANCAANYDATGRAFPLATQGAGAQADAYFDNPCGYTGEVYAYAYAEASSAANVVTISRQSDPAPDTPRIGTNVSATAAVSVGGVKDCYSHSYSSVTSYDLEVTYSRSSTNNACVDTVNARPFAQDSPANLLLPASPPLDPNSAAIVENLNSTNWHRAPSRDGIPVYDASAGTPRTIVCTEPRGTTCPLSVQPVPVHASWTPAYGEMSVIDPANRKVYDFYGVATNLDGTVKINSDGTVTALWGGVTSLDGNGQSPGANATDLSLLFGRVRLFEMERAASDPANAIQHALAFGSKYACAASVATYRYPAGKHNGSFTGAGCIPVGSRVFLDSSADCSAVSPAGEKAICYALQKYGAYLTGASSKLVFNLELEGARDGQPGGSGPDPYSAVGLGDDYGLQNIPWSKLKVAVDCRCSSSDLTMTGGRPFAQKAAVNAPLPSSPRLDANSAAMVANLNSSLHTASIYAWGNSVFDASAGTPRTIVCWDRGGACDLSLQPVPINPGWKPSSVSKEMTVIDYVKRKVYDFEQVSTDPDGTVKIEADGSVRVAWGRVADLDGNGQSLSLALPDLFGTVRVFEMARAASDPVNAIQHSLAIISKYTCTTWRYPAISSDGTFTGTGCIPAGSRVFLESSADCSVVSPVGAKAVCYALKKYGAYVLRHTNDTAFSFLFETPTPGQPGGSGADPYPGVGFTADYYNLTSIPWSRLKVAKDCQCTPY